MPPILPTMATRSITLPGDAANPFLNDVPSLRQHNFFVLVEREFRCLQNSHDP